MDRFLFKLRVDEETGNLGLGRGEGAIMMQGGWRGEDGEGAGESETHGAEGHLARAHGRKQGSDSRNVHVRCFQMKSVTIVDGST